MAIGHLAEEFNLLILSDEVYDVMTLDDAKPHIRMASLENFWERTITVGSGQTCPITPLRDAELTLIFVRQAGKHSQPQDIGESILASLRPKANGSFDNRVGWMVGPEHLINPTLAASTRIGE